MFCVGVLTSGCWQVDHARTLKHQITLIIDFPDSSGNFKKHLPYTSGASSHISFALNFLPSHSVCLTVCLCMEQCNIKGHSILPYLCDTFAYSIQHRVKAIRFWYFLLLLCVCCVVFFSLTFLFLIPFCSKLVSK